MILFNYFEPLFNYVEQQRKEGFAKVNFVTFNAIITDLIVGLDKSTDHIPLQDLLLAKFAVYSWIDEVVQRSTWAEKATWQQQLLQERYLSTSNAGEQFFIKLVSLEQTQAEVARIYFRCLALGFRGKYFRPEDAMEIRKLEQFCLDVMQINTGVEHAEKKKIFSTLYLALTNKSLLLGKDYERWYENKWVLWCAPIGIFLIIYGFFYGILHFTISNYLTLLT